MKETKVKEEITMGDLGNHIACPFCLEKDKQIKELEQKVQELQELDNKRAFRLYCMLYDILEIQDPENVASRIDYLTGKDYSEMCELYKTAKNLKQHDRELVKEVCERIREHLSEQKKSLKDTFSPYSNGKAFIISAVEENLNKIEKEYEK